MDLLKAVRTVQLQRLDVGDVGIVGFLSDNFLRQVQVTEIFGRLGRICPEQERDTHIQVPVLQQPIDDRRDLVGAVGDGGRDVLLAPVFLDQLVPVELDDGRLDVHLKTVHDIERNILPANREGDQDGLWVGRVLDYLVSSLSAEGYERVVLGEVDVVEDVLTERLVNTFSGVHNLR